METTRWSSYEVLPGERAASLLTLAGAHPDARIERDPAAVETARTRLYPDG